MKKTFIIAEAGVNHNGSLELALKLVEAAAKAGADAVKFQTFKTELMTSANAPKAEYQKLTTSGSQSQFDMLKKLELNEEYHLALINRCGKLGIEFLSSPFDLKSLELLCSTTNISKLKIPSGEITNGPLLVAAARSGKRIILSTGASNLKEVEEGLCALAFGYISDEEAPAIESFSKAFCSKEGSEALKQKVSLLHCVTEYPAPFEAVNLRAMITLKEHFELRVGYSDHTLGLTAAIAAVSMGAEIIEKHFTLDKNMPGPDHQCSLDPDELKLMVDSIRQVEAALGSGDKSPAPAELKNRDIVRKSLVAACDINKGDRYSSTNITAKRPGSGVSPMRFWELMGQEAKRSYVLDEVIDA